MGGPFLILILAPDGNPAKGLLFQGPGRSRLLFRCLSCRFFSIFFLPTEHCHAGSPKKEEKVEGFAGLRSGAGTPIWFDGSSIFFQGHFTDLRGGKGGGKGGKRGGGGGRGGGMTPINHPTGGFL